METYSLFWIAGSLSVVPNIIRLEGISATSVSVVLALEASSSGDAIDYMVWHRKAMDSEYPVKPACSLSGTSARFVVSGLTPSTEYIFKVVSYSGSKVLRTSESRTSTSSSQRVIYPRRQAIERSRSPTVNGSSLSNPSSVEDETNNLAHFNEQNDNSDNDNDYCKDADKIITGSNASAIVGMALEGIPAGSVCALDDEVLAENKFSKSKPGVSENNQVPKIGEDVTNDKESDSEMPTGLECVPFVMRSEGGLPITPCKLENNKDGHRRVGRSKNGKNDTSQKDKEPPKGGSSSKKSGADKNSSDFFRNESPSDRDFAYYVKVIRWLECEGYIETNFRQKFLTWYSLRATTEETRIVRVFVDAFIEDPSSLAGQLVDTFSETISNDTSSKSSVVPAGFCMKLWH